MTSSYIYRLICQLKRKKLAILIALIAISAVGVSLFRLDSMADKYGNYHPEAMLGMFSLVLIFAFDYAFAVGFRCGVLGYSLSDVTFHLASPFTPLQNLWVSIVSASLSWLFFLWFIAANSPFLAIFLGAHTVDILRLIPAALLTMTVIFTVTSYISARWCDSIAVRLAPVTILIIYHLVIVILTVRDLISEFGSLDAARSRGAVVLLERIGNSPYIDSFPIAGWIGTILKGGSTDPHYSLTIIGAVLMIFFFALYLFSRSKFDYYEHAYANAQTIADIIESSKAGVEAVNTGIQRTARVGNEKLKHGWGASAFFHMHLFENKRTSKLFFVNKVALIYRVFGLLFLLVVDGIIDEIYDVVVIILGIVTMLVLNSIVFGGGKTVFEFNRPYLFMVPEKSWKKLASCILSDVPEMLFDSIICTLIVKAVAAEQFGIGAMISFVFLMVSFDLLSETTGLVCVRLFRSLGKFALMGIRYLAVLVFIVIGMIPATIVTGNMSSDTLEGARAIIGILILVMGLTYFSMWVVITILARGLVDKTDCM
ncbi:MAG: hypothetical protein IKN14_00725 [Clostridiales bacterium]|nr:hypothetical protein [Clostridiales bacterium]